MLRPAPSRERALRHTAAAAARSRGSLSCQQAALLAHKPCGALRPHRGQSRPAGPDDNRLTLDRGQNCPGKQNKHRTHAEAGEFNIFLFNYCLFIILFWIFKKAYHYFITFYPPSCFSTLFMSYFLFYSLPPVLAFCPPPYPFLFLTPPTFSPVLSFLLFFCLLFFLFSSPFHLLVSSPLLSFPPFSFPSSSSLTSHLFPLTLVFSFLPFFSPAVTSLHSPLLSFPLSFPHISLFISSPYPFLCILLFSPCLSCCFLLLLSFFTSMSSVLLSFLSLYFFPPFISSCFLFSSLVSTPSLFFIFTSPLLRPGGAPRTDGGGASGARSLALTAVTLAGANADGLT